MNISLQNIGFGQELVIKVDTKIDGNGMRTKQKIESALKLQELIKERFVKIEAQILLETHDIELLGWLTHNHSLLQSLIEQSTKSTKSVDKESQTTDKEEGEAV